MDNRLLRTLSMILSVILVSAALVSCSADSTSGTSAETETADSKNTAPDGAADTTPPEEVPTDNGVTVKYGMANGQWGQFARYEYNARGQITSVTAVSPYSLAPLCYETIKSDRVYIYGEDGRMTRVWVSYGYAFELAYSDDGLTAEGACEKDGGIHARLTFTDKQTLAREEYISKYGTTAYEYDADGRIGSIMQETGFTTEHTYAEDRITMTVKNQNAQKLLDYVIHLEGDRIAGISAADSAATEGVMLRYTYEGGLLVKSDYSELGGGIYNMAYDSEGRVVSVKTEGEYTSSETFEYGADGRISRYTRETKSRAGQGKDTLTYTYASDGTVSRAVCERVEYDKSGNETSRREEEL